MRIEELKSRRDSLIRDIADREQEQAAAREILATVERQIAGAEKPPLRFNVGDDVLIPAKVTAVDVARAEQRERDAEIAESRRSVESGWIAHAIRNQEPIR